MCNVQTVHASYNFTAINSTEEINCILFVVSFNKTDETVQKLS